MAHSGVSTIASALTSPFPRALVRLCSHNQRQLWGLRFARLYGIGIGVSYAVLALVMDVPSAGASRLWARALATASWVAGVGALSLATDLSARDAVQGLTGLSRLRGFGEPELERARTLAGAIRLSGTVLMAGGLSCLGLMLRFHTLRGTLLAVALGLVTLPYSALVGGTLAVLARSCQHWLPGRGRLLLLAVTLGPWLLGSGLGAPVPSIPGAFGWLLDHIAGSVR